MQRVSAALLAILALGAVVLGLWQTGGPEQARAERRDDMRKQDLRALASHKACLRRADPNVNCGDIPQQTDRFTDIPYRIEADRVCATFERPDRLPDYPGSRFKDGCLSFD